MRIFITCILLLLVCRIFEFRNEGPDGCAGEITKWLQGKKFIEMRQSSTEKEKELPFYEVVIIEFVDREPIRYPITQDLRKIARYTQYKKHCDEQLYYYNGYATK